MDFFGDFFCFILGFFLFFGLASFSLHFPFVFLHFPYLSFVFHRFSLVFIVFPFVLLHFPHFSVVFHRFSLVFLVFPLFCLHFLTFPSFCFVSLRFHWFDCIFIISLCFFTLVFFHVFLLLVFSMVFLVLYCIFLIVLLFLLWICFIGFPVSLVFLHLPVYYGFFLHWFLFIVLTLFCCNLYDWCLLLLLLLLVVVVVVVVVVVAVAVLVLSCIFCGLTAESHYDYACQWCCCLAVATWSSSRGPTIKKGGRGARGEGAAPPPAMRSMLLVVVCVRLLVDTMLSLKKPSFAAFVAWLIILLPFYKCCLHSPCPCYEKGTEDRPLGRWMGQWKDYCC